MEKIDARKLSTEAQQQLRNQAIRLKKAGRTYKEIAEITGVHGTTACKWYKAYLRGGKTAVTIKKPGWTKSILKFLNELKKKTQKFIGAMRQGCVTIATMGEVMRPGAKRRQLSFIQDANVSI